MTEIKWDAVGDRRFETGVDRGVLYPPVGPGVPWNGLVSVTESSEGGNASPLYLDGRKYYNESSSSEFIATIEAFTYPDEFSEIVGEDTSGGGLLFGQQDRKEFGLSYRTVVGTDINDSAHYKIHLLYNALASPDDRSYETKNSTSDPTNLKWSITTRGIDISGRKNTAFLTIDSRNTDMTVLGKLNALLYGDEFTNSRLPSIAEVVTLFDDWPFLEINRSPLRGLSQLTYRGLHDLKGDYRTGIYKAPSETRLSQTKIPGLYRI